MTAHPYTQNSANKFLVLDLAMWVEEVRVSARGQEGQGVHSRCGQGGTCLPLGDAAGGLEGQQHIEGLEEGTRAACWLAQQVQFEFYSKPMAPSKVMLASSAQLWESRCPPDGKAAEEEELAWNFLEVLYFCPTHSRVGVVEDDAEEGGGVEGWRAGGLAHQSQ